MRPLLLLVAFYILCGCGVKGDPVPPQTPPELGRGRPTYRRAVEGLDPLKPLIQADPQVEDKKEGL